MLKSLLLTASLLACAAASATDDKTIYYPVPKAPFSEATQVGNILYLSGQVGSVPGQNHLAEGGFAAEAKQTMDNIGVTLKNHGLSYDDLFKCTIMLADMKNWPDFNKIYVPYFNPERLPARSAIGAFGLAMGAAVEIECWANVNH